MIASGPTGQADALFDALSDATRRSIVKLLVQGGPNTATNLAARLTISRQAVAKHLAQLSASGLTISHRVGRETRYTIDPGPLTAVTDWVAGVERDWTTRLELLAASLGDDLEQE